MLSSARVFLSWHCLHKLLQLLRSQNSLWSPRCGVMWSTTVAFTYRGGCFFMHSTHSGCACRYSRLAFCHFLPYPRFAADRTSSGCSALCFSQYFVPGSTSCAQPGCLQGTFGLYGIPIPPTEVRVCRSVRKKIPGCSPHPRDAIC